jgi:parallel beta-helix repeat protein
MPCHRKNWTKSAVFTALAVLSLMSAVVRAANLPVVTLSPDADSIAIQRALNGLKDGGEVILPAGTYTIDRPIFLNRDNLTLRGSGPGTVLALADDANCPVIIMGAATSRLNPPTAHLRLAGFTIDGNRKHQAREFWQTAVDGSQLNNNGVDIWNTVECEVTNVVCRHCRSGGLVTAGGVRRLTVRDLTVFDSQFDGIACYQTEDSHFSKLFLHDNVAAGISLDLSFNHNVIEDAVLSGNDLGVFMRYSRDNKFSGITIQNSRHHGIFMAQTGSGTKRGWQLVPGTECTGNNFAALNISDSGGKPFLINNASCTNNVIAEVGILDAARDVLIQTTTKIGTIK